MFSKRNFLLITSLMSSGLVSVLIILLFSGQNSFAAACCGGSSALPAIISADNKAQLSLSYASSEVVVNSVDNQGYWYRSDQTYLIRTLKIDGSHIIDDLWQIGFSAPLQEKEFAKQKQSGLSDLSLFTGYEFMPVWDYHPYKPKGIGFLQLNIPMGKSKFDVDDPGLSARGNGQWSVGLGTLFTKTFGIWDTAINIEGHHFFEKNISRSETDAKILSSNGYSYGATIGYNLGDFRAGVSAQWNQESAKDIQTDSSKQDGFVEQYATAGLNFSYMLDRTLSISAALTDQTLLGDPKNTSLSRGISFAIQTQTER